MEHQDVLVVLEGLLGQVAVELDRFAIVSEEETLVDPVSDKEEQGSHGIEEWHAARVKQTHG